MLTHTQLTPRCLGRGCGRPSPRQTGTPLSQRAPLLLGGDTVGVPSGSCLRALLGASVSAHFNPTCMHACMCVSYVHACMCVCSCACIHMHTPMSGHPLICCQWSYSYCTSYTQAHRGNKPKQPFILRSRLPVQAEAPGGRRSAGAPLFHCIHSLVLGTCPKTLLLQVTGSKPLLPGPSLLSPPDATDVLSPLGQALTLCPQTTGLNCQLF